MTTIEPTIFHKYLHKVCLFLRKLHKQRRKDAKNKCGKKDTLTEGERVRERECERDQNLRPKKSDENHTELSSANR